MYRVATPARRNRRSRPSANQRYFMRCPDLDVSNWEPFTGPSAMHTAVRIKAERMDRDAAFPVALGGKTAVVEVRREDSAEIFRFEVTGNAAPYYQVQPEGGAAETPAEDEAAPNSGTIAEACAQLRSLVAQAEQEDDADELRTRTA
jgi:hypothetical protein